MVLFGKALVNGCLNLQPSLLNKVNRLEDVLSHCGLDLALIEHSSLWLGNFRKACLGANRRRFVDSVKLLSVQEQVTKLGRNSKGINRHKVCPFAGFLTLTVLPLQARIDRSAVSVTVLSEIQPTLLDHLLNSTVEDFDVFFELHDDAF